MAKSRPRSPTADRLALATALRELREEARLSLEVAAREALEASAAKLSRIETNRQAASPRDVRDLCVLYGASATKTQRLMTLAASARQAGWWESFAINDDDFVGLENAATHIRDFEVSTIPGLLQVREYAEGYLSALIGPGRREPWSRSELQEWLQLRDRRRVILEPDSGVSFSFVIDEAAVLRSVGRAMKTQIDHLLKVADQPNVDLRVLPLSSGASPGQLGAFIMLTLPDAPDVGYVESQSGFQLLDAPEDLRRLDEVFRRVQAASLDAQASKEALRRAASGFS